MNEPDVLDTIIETCVEALEEIGLAFVTGTPEYVFFVIHHLLLGEQRDEAVVTLKENGVTNDGDAETIIDIIDGGIGVFGIFREPHALPAADDYTYLSKDEFLLKYNFGPWKWDLFDQIDKRREQEGYPGKREFKERFISRFGKELWDIGVKKARDEPIT